MITNTFPVTLHEVAYLHAEQEQRSWFVVYRPEQDAFGVTAQLGERDEVIMTCESEGQQA